MESNALSGLHYGPVASLVPLVPYDFVSAEPYLLSKRFHLNSINLSKLPWASAAQLGAAVAALGAGATRSPAGLGSLGGSAGTPCTPQPLSVYLQSSLFVHPLPWLPQPPSPSCWGFISALIVGTVCNA